jgi:hypothetical protein
MQKLFPSPKIRLNPRNHKILRLILPFPSLYKEHSTPSDRVIVNLNKFRIETVDVTNKHQQRSSVIEMAHLTVYSQSEIKYNSNS